MELGNFERQNAVNAYYRSLEKYLPSHSFPEYYTDSSKEMNDLLWGLTREEIICLMKYLYLDKLNLHEYQKAESILRQCKMVSCDKLFMEFDKGTRFDMANISKAYSYFAGVTQSEEGSSNLEDRRNDKFEDHIAYMTYEELLAYLKYWYFEMLGVEMFNIDDNGMAESILRQYQLIRDNSLFKELDMIGS